MPKAYKTLGQAAPLMAADTTLYTVPAATQTIVSTITVANRGSEDATYRVAVRVAGASISPGAYLFYDISIPGNATDAHTLGITLAPTDVITVRASTANVTFQAFGTEIT